jgi:hypothetical protein
MAKIEHIREVLSGPLTREHLEERAAAGWEPAAIEWRRVTDAPAGAGLLSAEVPFGLQISADCSGLEENPAEKEGLLIMMELIVQDEPISRVAAELNRRGLHMRNGGAWTAAAVFEMLPRLIDAGPRLFTSGDWVERRRHFANIH